MIRAIIFDLDGTLADTESLHFEAFRAILAPHGVALARERYFNDLIACSDRDCLTLLLREKRPLADSLAIDRLIAEKAALYQTMITGRDLLYPGAADFVREAAARFPLALVTGTLRAEAELILGRAGLRDRFVEVVAAEDVAAGKPAPDGFEIALGRLGFILRMRPGLRADECLAVEDTAAGVAAAKAAGMRVMGVAQTARAEELRAADLVVASLAQADLDSILRALAQIIQLEAAAQRSCSDQTKKPRIV